MAVNADTGSWSVSWPWPRALFIGSHVLGFATVSTALWLYEMYYEYGQWSAVALASLGTTTEIDQVDVADFGTFYMVSVYGTNSDGVHVINGYARVVSEGSGADAVAVLPTTSIPKFATCCNFNGQCVAGGIDEAGAWTGIKLNYVMWSGIGNAEFRIAQDLTAGSIAIPWARSWETSGQGMVYKVAKLGNTVAVYGDEGRASLVPYGIENAVGFGLGRTAGGGVTSGNHVAGDENVHAFIDNNEDLWIADSQGEKKLGYREYMSSLLDHANRTIISYVPSKKRFYISNGVEGYVLSEHGLYTTNQLVTSVGDYRNSGLFGFWADSEDSRARFTTDTVDFGIRGLKTLAAVELGINTLEVDQDVEVSSYWRSGIKDAFSQTDWTLTDPMTGVGNPVVTANEFRVSVRAASYSGMKVDYVGMRYKLVDKRAIRGIYPRGS